MPLALAALGELLVERAGLDQHRPRGRDPRRRVRRARRRVQRRRGRCGFASAIAAGCWSSRCFRALRRLGSRRSDHHRHRADAAQRRARRARSIARSSAARGAASAHSDERTAADPRARRPARRRHGALLRSHRSRTSSTSLAPALAWWLTRTHAGLALRAIGERPDAAEAAGIAVDRVRVTRHPRSAARSAASLAARWCSHRPAPSPKACPRAADSSPSPSSCSAAGRLAAWSAGALLFGAASALQFAFQAMGWNVPYQLFLVVPYLLTLAALAGARRSARAPAALGQRPGAATLTRR